MANVVRDPREHPDAIIPDFSKPDPLLTFSKDDIAFVYGSKWKQRYFKKVGDDYFPLPAQWDITHKVWRAYNVKAGTDWWTPYYPGDNMHAFRRWDCAQESHARKRLRYQPHVCTRSYLLQLPRYTRYGQRCAFAETG